MSSQQGGLGDDAKAISSPLLSCALPMVLNKLFPRIATQLLFPLVSELRRLPRRRTKINYQACSGDDVVGMLLPSFGPTSDSNMVMEL